MIRLAHPDWHFVISFHEHQTPVLVLENPVEYRRLVAGLLRQTGRPGEPVALPWMPSTRPLRCRGHVSARTASQDPARDRRARQFPLAKRAYYLLKRTAATGVSLGSEAPCAGREAPPRPLARARCQGPSHAHLKTRTRHAPARPSRQGFTSVRYLYGTL